jgi:DNA-binding beta-propeller fold protein YncE
MGEPGTAPGEFNVVHNICCDRDGWVYVADRENHRVQVFDGNLAYEAEWHNLHRPCGMYMESGADPLCYIGEVAPSLAINRHIPNLGPRLSIMNNKGELLARLGDVRAGLGIGQFIAPHGLAVDSRGDIYVGETSVSAWPQLFPGEPAPHPLRTLQKLVKLS